MALLTLVDILCMRALPPFPNARYGISFKETLFVYEAHLSTFIDRFR